MDNILKKAAEMRKNLKHELMYALPSQRIVENAAQLFFVFPDGSKLFIKNRHSESKTKDGEVFVVYKFYNTMEEADLLCGKSIEVKYSAFNQRGQDAILNFLTEIHRDKTLIQLEKSSKIPVDWEKIADSKEKSEKPEDPFDGISDKKVDFEDELKSFVKNIFSGEDKKTDPLNPFDFLSDSGDQMFSQKQTDFIKGFLDKTKTSPPFENKIGSGKAVMLQTLINQLPDLVSKLKGFENQETTSEQSGNSRILYNECKSVARLVNGQIEVLKSRDGKFPLESEFLVVTDTSQIEFYPKGFFKDKNVLIIEN